MKLLSLLLLGYSICPVVSAALSVPSEDSVKALYMSIISTEKEGLRFITKYQALDKKFKNIHIISSDDCTNLKPGLLLLVSDMGPNKDAIKSALLNVRKEIPDINSKNPKSKKIWIILSLVSLVVLLVILGLRLFSDDRSMLEMGEAPEDFSLTAFSGEKIQTSDLRGKILLVNFWASWCVTCDEEAVLLEQAWQDDYKFHPILHLP